ncbi:MAG TPA: aldehyde dehydrogenase family protein [Tepidisphaeraceae bacterium]|jgi:glyceraldehyde-3-phosphate dehydrogenase (NADP+)|nr:aldehyde dehydrogenase family protein [Tepidisphaeraceae bacterium]
MDLSHPRLLIGRDWVTSPKSYDVVDPYTGTTIASVPLGDAVMLDRAIEVAHAVFEITRRQPAFERAAVLHRAAALMEDRKALLTDTIVAEAGKPITLAHAEVSRAIMTLTASAEAARQPNGEVLDIDAFSSGAGHFGVARRFPIGVVYCITPFNFPLNLVCHKLGPVIATGNTAVLKPAPRTPLSALLLAEILRDAGMTPGQVNVVTVPNELASRPLADERVAMVSFTGSVKVGWSIREQAPRKRVVLELGGNAPAIVEPDADLETAIPMLATGGFGYAGQSCIHTQRIYVHEQIYDAFRSQYLAQVKDKVKAGDPRDPTTLVGPMIDRGNVDRVSNWVNEAIAGGATLLCGGSAEGSTYAPTVLENVPASAKVLCEEIFGPVVVLQPYKTFDEAIELANGTRYGIHASLFTRDLSKALAAYDRLDFGGVLINQAPTFRVETLPYGGVKDSGVGREGVRYAMEDMTEIKALVVKR